jgi:putative pyruvate formate lyase activating enzyme
VRTETAAGGVCGQPTIPVCAKAQLHLWEEPCLTGKHGAGAVFFSGCSLRCRFCQNGILSREGFGIPVSAARLREIYRDLIARGAACIDLVTPTHFTPAILESLDQPLPVPVVWNSGGYEKPSTLRWLQGKVQIFLPDLKYALPEPAARCSGAADYFDWASRAILEMFRQTGPYRMEGELLKSGVLIRHLLLPGELENTRRCIDWVAETFRPGDVLFSLMSQYTPQPGAEGNLGRHVTAAEYRAASEYLANCGISEGYTQERTSARAEYTPDFDLSGL